MKKSRGNKYDAPFKNMSRETARKIGNMNAPKKKGKATAK